MKALKSIESLLEEELIIKNTQHDYIQPGFINQNNASINLSYIINPYSNIQESEYDLNKNSSIQAFVTPLSSEVITIKPELFREGPGFRYKVFGHETIHLSQTPEYPTPLSTHKKEYQADNSGTTRQYMPTLKPLTKINYSID